MDIRGYSENVNIVTDKYSFYLLKEWKENGKLVFGGGSPDREWPQGRRARWIESILMDIPLAPVFANADYKGRLIVFDGFNRLSSVFAFMDNEYPLDRLQILRSYNGKTFDNLPLYLQSRISSFMIQLCIIKPGTDERVAASILQRVNVKSTPIHEQSVIDSLNKINEV